MLYCCPDHGYSMVAKTVGTIIIKLELSRAHTLHACAASYLRLVNECQHALSRSRSVACSSTHLLVIFTYQCLTNLCAWEENTWIAQQKNARFVVLVSHTM